MRILVLLCFSFLQLCVAVSSALAAGKPACPPAPTTSTSDAVVPPATPGSIVFNEILDNPSTKTLWNCTAQTNSPWLELFNPHDQIYDLNASLAVIDHGPGTRPIPLPGGSVIAAHGFLVIFMPVFQDQAALFRLLFQNTPIDQVMVPPLAIDQSYARVPDGMAAWQVTDTPTIGISNSSPVATTAATPSLSNASIHSAKPKADAHTSPKKQATHKQSRPSPTAIRASPFIAGKQPTWDNLYLPRLTPTAQASTGTDPPTGTFAPSEKGFAWPFLVASIGLPVAVGGLLYWPRKRMKAT